ncbi:M23 family metallopeptidase [Leucobacter luti]|uniref:Murein DD-endopeptidase MepM/ murein hydrolase activator NlpD n=1 Tax=Leucobacter luti TaxID=340320 RepID=A0A4Q7TKT8_9MICO|nr:M23 family metallopeptidase [Leucobacter luti]MBL3700263.1 M23 family metallopeptidase [Leucobacter luti]RZT61013.1 murein DD-endopeptidase MepM/ murein hydrolase activator NlpD [Leucobacter luti]
MPDTPPDERTPFPSRRSLRTATGSVPHTSHTSPATEHAAAPAESDSDATALSTPRAREASATPAEPSAGASGYVRVPVREHVPASPLGPEPTTDRPRRTLRRRIATVAAAACVGALALPAAIPFIQETEEAEVSASEQRLFSEVSSEDLPASLSDITAVAVEEATPGSFTFREDALVNYPFTATVLLTDPFGYRTAPVAQFHDAQDFGAAAGTPIQAIADGTVLEAGFASDGCGFGLKLEHDIDDQTVTSRYCHMEDASHNYSVGDTLKMGDPVGKVGATGLAFGAHLHLAMRLDDEPIDPMPFLAKYSRIDRDTVPSSVPETPAAPTTRTLR